MGCNMSKFKEVFDRTGLYLAMIVASSVIIGALGMATFVLINYTPVQRDEDVHRLIIRLPTFEFIPRVEVNPDV